MLLELIACGFLQTADRHTTDSRATKGFNTWRMGTSKILPQTARDLFVHGSLEHAARHEQVRAVPRHLTSYILPAYLGLPRVMSRWPSSHIP